MNLPDKPIIPCFLCGKPTPVKLTKKDKPYFVCDPCGLQVFVRCKPGILILKRLMKTIAKAGTKFQTLNQSSYQTLSLVSRLNELQIRLEHVRENKPVADYILSGSESETIERALKRSISTVLDALSGDRAPQK